MSRIEVIMDLIARLDRAQAIRRQKEFETGALFPATTDPIAPQSEIEREVICELTHPRNLAALKAFINGLASPVNPTALQFYKDLLAVAERRKAEE